MPVLRVIEKDAPVTPDPDKDPRPVHHTPPWMDSVSANRFSITRGGRDWAGGGCSGSGRETAPVHMHDRISILRPVSLSRFLPDKSHRNRCGIIIIIIIKEVDGDGQANPGQCE